MIIFFVVSLVAIVGLGWILRGWIYSLAVSKDGRPDVEAKKLASWIAVLFIVGSVFMVGILCFDYHGHATAAAKAEAKDAATAVASKTEVKAPGTDATAKRKVDDEVADDFIGSMGGFLGTFGDFFGGVVNPILTFGTLIALAVTILLQRVQLRDARSEASQNREHAYIQAFETTFFHLLNLHAENVKNLSFDPNIVPSNPTTAHQLKLAGLTPQLLSVVTGREVFEAVLKATNAGVTKGVSQLALYRQLQKQHNHVLGHYFRHLYQILNLVDKMTVEGNDTARYKIKKRYTNFLRAQLSSHELAVLFLNCTFETVDDGRFRELLIWYKFLEHLPVSITSKGLLSAPEINPDDQWIFFEYLSVGLVRGLSHLGWVAGAFGKNPAISQFLTGQALNWSGPVPWLTKKVTDRAQAGM